MIKKKVLSIGCAVVLAFSYLGTRVFANYGTGSNNSAEVEMTVDYNGNTVYEYTDAKGVTRTNGTTSKELTKGRYDYIYGILKMDSDNIVVTVTDAPKGGKTSFEIVSEYGGTIASSGTTRYGKGSSWSAKGQHGILGVVNNIRANTSVSGTYKFHLQW